VNFVGKKKNKNIKASLQSSPSEDRVQKDVEINEEKSFEQESEKYY